MLIVDETNIRIKGCAEELAGETMQVMAAVYRALPKAEREAYRALLARAVCADDCPCWEGTPEPAST